MAFRFSILKASCLFNAFVFILFLNPVLQAEMLPDVMARYPLDGHTNNTAAHENHGAVHGATTTDVTTTGSQTIQDAAYHFDGIDDYINLGNSIDIVNSSGFSISAWAKADDLIYNNENRTRPIVFKRKYGTTPRSFVPQFQILFDGRGGDDRVSFFMAKQTAGDEREFVESPKNKVAPHQWYHVVATYDAVTGEMVLYLDGASQGSKTNDNPPTSLNFSTHDVLIGRTTYGDQFQGKIDDVQFYNRVLSEAEVGILYNGGENPNLENTDHLTAHYSFEGNPDDVSGHDYNGILQDFGGGPVNEPNLVDGYDGQSNSAYYFTGGDYGINLGQIADPASAAGFTVSAWAKAEDLYYGGENRVRPIVFKQKYSGPAWAPQFGLMFDGRFNKDIASFFVAKNDTLDGREFVSTLSAPNCEKIRIDEWYHVTGVYDATTSQIKIYLNGSLKETKTHTLPPKIGSWHDVMIGRSSNGDNFHGSIDDVRLYHRALSDAEIASLAGTPPPSTNPPGLMILEPTQNQITGQTSIFVRAHVSHDSNTTVTSTPAGMNVSLPDIGGTAEGTVPLSQEGENTITIRAEDPCGYYSEETVTVIRDTENPIVIVPSPGTTFSVSQTSVQVSLDIFDTTQTTVDFHNGVVTVPAGGGLVFGEIQNLVPGINEVVLTVTDQVGLATPVTFFIILDQDSPIVTIDSPDNGAFFGVGEEMITVGVTIDDISPTDTISIPSGVVSGSLPTGGGILPGVWNLSEGLNTLTVTASDMINPDGSATVSVILDTIDPLIGNITPVVGAVVAETPIILEVDITDANTTTVTIDGNVSTVAGGATRTVSQSVDLLEGSNDIVIAAVDPAGNELSVTHTIILNSPPVPDIACEQIVDTGSQILFRFDGSGTADPGDAIEDLTFRWTLNGSVICDGDSTACLTVEENLDPGTHTVTLLVTDPLGATGETSKTVTVDPNSLSSFSIDRAVVNWGNNNVRIVVKGEIGLPFGVNYSELSPEANAFVNLADYIPAVLPSTAVQFNVSGGQNQKWKHSDTNSSFGLRTFNIDWDGARYDYVESGIPVRLKSEIITSTETVLSLRIRRRQIDTPFTIDFDGQESITIDENGNVTSSTIPYEVERPRRRFTLTIPFGFIDTTTITMTGGVSASLVASSHLKPSVGRYRVVTRADSNLFAEGVLTVPRKLDIQVDVGTQLYSGAVNLDHTELEIDGSAWRLVE